MLFNCLHIYNNDVHSLHNYNILSLSRYLLHFARVLVLKTSGMSRATLTVESLMSSIAIEFKVFWYPSVIKFAWKLVG